MGKRHKFPIMDVESNSSSASSSDDTSPHKARRRKRRSRSSVNARKTKDKDNIRMMVEQLNEQMGNLIENQNDQSNEMKRLIESQNGQSKVLEKLIESQNGQSKELEKLTACITKYLGKQLEFHTNITGHAESNAPRSQMNQVPPPRYQLVFRFVPTDKIETGKTIKITVALVEAISGRPVEDGPLASITVELVVVNSKFNQYDNQHNWSREDFERNIVKPRCENSAAGGADQSVKSIVSNGRFNLDRGVGCYSGSAIFENSHNRKVRLAAMAVFPTEERVLEALSNPLLVRDHVQSGKQSNLHPNSSNGQSNMHPNSSNGQIDDGEAMVEEYLHRENTTHMGNGHVLGPAMDMQFPRTMPVQLVWDKPNVGPIKRDWNLLDQLTRLPKFSNCGGLPTKRLMQEHLVYSRTIMSKEAMQARRNTGVIIEPLEPDDSDDECVPQFVFSFIELSKLYNNKQSAHACVCTYFIFLSITILITFIHLSNIFFRRQLKRKMCSKYQLRFMNKVCEGYHIMDPIKADDGNPLKVALFDGNRKITNGPLSSAPVKIVAGDEAAVIDGAGSFKEESNLVSDLPDPERTALAQLKELVAAALANGEFDLPPPPPAKEEAANEEAAPAKDEEPKAETVAAEEPAKGEAKLAAAEEPKAEAPAEAAAEEVKAEAPAPEEPKAEEPAKEEEEPKAEAASEEAKPPEPEEKTVVVAEEEGTKTVEAIKETVVPAAPEPAAATAEAEAPAAEPKEELIWGVPLVGDDERTDTVLLKFLRAREFKVKEAMAMLKSAVLWRKRFGIDELLGADLGLPELEKVVFYRGADRESHPVCYNVYGEFQDKELYEKAFGDEEKRERFLKWRIQLLERGIREQLDFSPSGICSMVQVTDLKNSPPMLGKHRAVTRQALALLQDNYPEFVAKKVFINVPWWYLAANKVMSPFLTQRTKSKIVFCSPGKSAETLFRCIAPEQVPVQFGGLYKEDDTEFSTSDAVTELTIKPSSKETIEIPATENSTVVWELRVLGWEVSYGAEFTPDAEGGYTVIVQKTRKLPAHEEPIMKGSFKVNEPGKVLLTVNNPTSKKKKLLYRFKVKSTAESA